MLEITTEGGAVQYIADTASSRPGGCSYLETVLSMHSQSSVRRRSAKGLVSGRGTVNTTAPRSQEPKHY
jgi:hypothetical protein